MKTVKLTKDLLRQLVKEEAGKFGKMKDPADVSAEETEADELADSLEKKIDYAKALKIEETRLKKRLEKIQEAKLKLAREIAID